jgi:hypothetical protein
MVAAAAAAERLAREAGEADARSAAGEGEELPEGCSTGEAAEIVGEPEARRRVRLPHEFGLSLASAPLSRILAARR